ncbi:MAG: PIN domain-containing protein [Chthoniobacterales bacterium]
MSWLLDADVLSHPAKSRPEPGVIAWLRREEARVYTSAIVIAQLAFWVRTKQGGQRQKLQLWLRELIDALEGRILSFNVSVAHVWAEQRLLFERTGIRMPVEDSFIAATARRHHLTIVTGNDRDFRRPGLQVFNPFKELHDV